MCVYVYVCVCVCVCVCARCLSGCIHSSVYQIVSVSPHPSVHLCLHMITCVHLHSNVRARMCFHLFPQSGGLCTLKGVPCSQLRERGKQDLKQAAAFRAGTRDERENKGEWECRKVAPECRVCRFEPHSRCLCIANIANIS